MAWYQGDLESAQSSFEESMVIYRELGAGCRWSLSLVLQGLGMVADVRHDKPAAHRFYAESLALRRELGDRWGLAQSLDDLGARQLADGDLDAAHTSYVEALEIARQTGDRRLIATELSGLASLAAAQGDVSRAVTLYAEALPLDAELHDRWGAAGRLSALAELAARADQAAAVATAPVLWGSVEGLFRAMGARRPSAERDQRIAATRSRLGDTAFEAAWSAGRGMTFQQGVAYALAAAQTLAEPIVVSPVHAKAFTRASVCEGKLRWADCTRARGSGLGRTGHVQPRHRHHLGPERAYRGYPPRQYLVQARILFPRTDCHLGRRDWSWQHGRLAG